MKKDPVLFLFVRTGFGDSYLGLLRPVTGAVALRMAPSEATRGPQGGSGSCWTLRPSALGGLLAWARIRAAFAPAVRAHLSARR